MNFFELPNPASTRGQDPAGLIRRDLADVQVRSIDEKKRTAEFVAATENGVRGYSGMEYLRMAGARLQRFRKNPVVLDTHNRFEVGAILGSAAVRIEGRELLSMVTFAETARAETAWQLVKAGHLRAVSVGFIPNRARTVELRDGETDGTGESQIVGPARIVKEWELFEISVVPVPADAAAVARGLYLAPAVAVEPEQQVRRLEEISAAELARAICG